MRVLAIQLRRLNRVDEEPGEDRGPRWPAGVFAATQALGLEQFVHAGVSRGALREHVARLFAPTTDPVRLARRQQLVEALFRTARAVPDGKRVLVVARAIGSPRNTGCESRRNSTCL